MTKFNRLKLLLFTLFLNSLNLAYSHEVINSHNEKDFQVSVFQAVNQKTGLLLMTILLKLKEILEQRIAFIIFYRVC